MLQGQVSVSVSCVSLAFILLISHDESSYKEKSVRLPFYQVFFNLSLLDVLVSFFLIKYVPRWKYLIFALNIQTNKENIKTYVFSHDKSLGHESL